MNGCECIVGDISVGSILGYTHNKTADNKPHSASTLTYYYLLVQALMLNYHGADTCER